MAAADDGVFGDTGVIFESRMSDSDALMWTIEKDPALRSTIVSVSFFDGRLDPLKVRRRIDRLSRVIPRLRQRVRSNPMSIAPPRWEIDPLFDLNYHLRYTRVPGEGARQDVLRLAEPIAMQGFDRARPQWECTVVDGYDGDKTALIWKVHHSMTDGVGGVKLQLELMDLSADAEPRPMPSPPDAVVLSQPERFADAFEHEMRRGATMASRWATKALASVFGAAADPTGALESANELVGSIGRVTRPAPDPLSDLMTRRSLSVHLDVVSMPLDLAKKAAARVDGRMNDAFVAAMALGIQSYHRQMGTEVSRLRMAIPINVRAANQGNVAGNAFIPARLELGFENDDPEDMMRNVHRQVLGAREEPANDLLDVMSNMLNRLPTTFTTAFFATVTKGTDFATSNVPGFPIAAYMDGVRMESQFPFGPMAGAALNITLLSYMNDCNIGVNMDPAAVTDPELMMSCLNDGIDRILDLA